jgi:quinol monooxygenase YgiN
MSTKLTLFARLKAKPGKEGALRDAMMKMVPASRAEAGCINYDLHVENSDPSVYWVYENWKDEAALAAHTQEPHYLELGKVKDDILAEPAQLIRLTEVSAPAQAQVAGAHK